MRGRCRQGARGGVAGNETAVEALQLEIKELVEMRIWKFSEMRTVDEKQKWV